MTPITHDDPIQEIEFNLFEAEASALGLRPGDWPSHLPTTMGNGLPFIRTSYKASERDGELLYMLYRQTAGSLLLRIHND